MAETFGLEGLRILVTGGSRGIGAACCRRFAAAGAAVWVHYHRRRDRAEQLLEELPLPVPPPPGMGSPLLACQAPHHQFSGADMADPEAVGALLSEVRDTWGGLDVLVNNAGLWWPSPLGALTEDDALAKARTLLDTNLLGPFLAVSAALPLFEGSPAASIVNVTSTAGQRGEAGYSVYAATKGGLISATKSWAVELAPRVRVNAVAPGWVDTDTVADAFAGGGRERYEAEIPLGRVATADDVAATVLFLASPTLARHVTGEILNVNGGSVLAG